MKTAIVYRGYFVNDYNLDLEQVERIRKLEIAIA